MHLNMMMYSLILHITSMFLLNLQMKRYYKNDKNTNKKTHLYLTTALKICQYILIINFILNDSFLTDRCEHIMSNVIKIESNS